MNKKHHTAFLLCGLIFFMLSLSFAAVPLYRIFCQKTGYGGTPQIVQASEVRVGNRQIKIQFNGDTYCSLPWTFRPLQHEIKTRVGERLLAFYRVKNRSREPVVGIASYNVTPDKAAIYFHKIDCFCFDEQTLTAGQEVDMGVDFYIDPAFENDPEMADVSVITLSYTFYKSKDFKWPF